MIEGYIGRPGSGKSYTITERVLREADRGRPVFANYAIAHPNVWLFGPEDLLHLPPGLVVIDEAHLWFPARMSLRLPASWLAGMSQTRKKGWDMLWASQHESRVDRVIRDVSSWLWLCSAWKGVGSSVGYFTARSWEPEFFRDPKRQQTRTVRRFNQRVADSYDTFESLTVAAHAQSADDAYAPGDPDAPAPRRRSSKRTASALDAVEGF